MDAVASIVGETRGGVCGDDDRDDGRRGAPTARGDGETRFECITPPPIRRRRPAREPDENKPPRAGARARAW